MRVRGYYKACIPRRFLCLLAVQSLGVVLGGSGGGRPRGRGPRGDAWGKLWGADFCDPLVFVLPHIFSPLFSFWQLWTLWGLRTLFLQILQEYAWSCPWARMSLYYLAH